MLCDLQARELICYLGEQEKERTPAPQLEAVRQHKVPNFNVWRSNNDALSLAGRQS